MRACPIEEFTVINRIAFSFLAALLACSALAADLTDAQRAAIEERIKPVGTSCMAGDSSCGGAAAAVAGGAPRTGKEVFDTSCMACHSTGAAGAPKYGDKAAWGPRIAKGTDALYASFVNGVPGTAMVAKGGCASCSEEEFHAAVDYMVAGSQ
jgi:cytochrome c5